MSQANLELIRRHYGDFNHGDLDAVMAAIAPDAVFAGADPVAERELGRRWTGRAEIREFFERLREIYSHNTVEVLDMQAADGLVISSIRISVTSRKTRVSRAARAVHVFSVLDGRIQSVLYHRNGHGENRQD